jgi:hypothetical protein
MKYFLILLLLGGCASLKKKPELSADSRDLPAWIYSPYEECLEAEFLCATGEAKETNNADAQAKANLASIFEVKINSELNVTTSSSQSFPWQSQVKQEVQQSLKESVNQVLETVQIKKRFRKDRLSYSLASLDRQKASELLGGRMIKIDHELETLWANRQRTNLRRIVKLQTERDKLNERYSIVAGAGRAAPVSYADIVKWKESRPKAEPLALRIGQAPDWMTEKIKELLTESGFKLVKGEANKILTVQVDSIKEFLNVNGFEKYTFTLNMTSIESGEKKKVISASETVTGRTQGDALLKVKSFFNDYIELHLADLHLD